MGHKICKTWAQQREIIKTQRELIISLNNQLRAVTQHNSHLKDCIISVREQTEKGYRNV